MEELRFNKVPRRGRSLRMLWLIGYVVLLVVSILIGLLGEKFEKVWVVSLAFSVVLMAVGVLFAFTQGGGNSLLEPAPNGVEVVQIDKGFGPDSYTIPLFLSSYFRTPESVTMLLMGHAALPLALLLAFRIFLAEKFSGWWDRRHNEFSFEFPTTGF